MNDLRQRLRSIDPVLRTGRVRKILPTYIEADGPSLPLGSICDVEARSGPEQRTFPAEIVRVDTDGVVLSPFEQGASTFAGALVRSRQRLSNLVPVGERVLGRAVDALGRPIDAEGTLSEAEHRPLSGAPLPPLERSSPREILETGLRAIDGLLTLGKGQRVGIFAASGVGKTSLLAQLARQTNADILILCLVGERGREVEALWNEGLDADARARSTLVAATSDQSAAMRVRAGHYALALAEYWRNQGKHVLLLLDSVTRLAMAMREMGLAAGEPPTIRAYTPSVFALIPSMVERCGALKSGGAVTAIMTVLSETDDVDDPICELMKSLLDGHIILSRSLAEQGQFPAIDVLRSVSRHADSVVTAAQREHAQKVLGLMSFYDTSRTLIDTGLYVRGSNPEIDRAIDQRPAILRFLKQDRAKSVPSVHTMVELADLAGGRS